MSLSKTLTVSGILFKVDLKLPVHLAIEYVVYTEIVLELMSDRQDVMEIKRIRVEK